MDCPRVAVCSVITEPVPCSHLVTQFLQYQITPHNISYVAICIRKAKKCFLRRDAMCRFGFCHILYNSIRERKKENLFKSTRRLNSFVSRCVAISKSGYTVNTLHSHINCDSRFTTVHAHTSVQTLFSIPTVERSQMNSNGLTLAQGP